MCQWKQEAKAIEIISDRVMLRSGVKHRLSDGNSSAKEVLPPTLYFSLLGSSGKNRYQCLEGLAVEEEFLDIVKWEP